MFGPNLPALARTRRVIAVDLQGHGRTTDVDRPFRYESMADDIAALVRHLGFDHADVVGYSLGGGVAMQTAIRHRDVVRRLVVIGAPFARHAFYPEVLAAFDAMDASIGAQMSQSPLASMYPAVDWTNLFGKLGDLLRRDYDWSEEVAGIEAPVMLVFADADAVRPAHIAEFYTLVGGGRGDAGLDGSDRAVDRLAILPGTTHYDILATDRVAGLIEPFLAAAPSSVR